MRRLIIVILLLTSLYSDAQIINASHSYRPAIVSSCSYLLDTYTGAAAAYSLRKLDCDYTGYAIRVRRSSDNTEQDIGFTSSGDLDTATLKTFVGANSGYVITWYDQAGSNNATQSSTTLQPYIISTGVIERVNGKPAIYFYDVSTRLASTSGSGTSTSNTMATVAKFNPSSGSYNVQMSIGSTASTNCYAHIGSNTLTRRIYRNGTSSDDGNTTTNQELWTSSTNSSGNKFWVNGSSQTMSNASQVFTSDLSNVLLGSDAFGSGLRGRLQEAIFWNSTKSDSDISNINSNINNYYSIY